MRQENWHTRLNLASIVRDTQEEIASIVVLEEKATAKLERVWTHPFEYDESCAERAADLITRLSGLAQRRNAVLSRQSEMKARLKVAEANELASMEFNLMPRSELINLLEKAGGGMWVDCIMNVLEQAQTSGGMKKAYLKTRCGLKESFTEPLWAILRLHCTCLGWDECGERILGTPYPIQFGENGVKAEPSAE